MGTKGPEACPDECSGHAEGTLEYIYCEGKNALAWIAVEEQDYARLRYGNYQQQYLAGECLKHRDLEIVHARQRFIEYLVFALLG